MAIKKNNKRTLKYLFIIIFDLMIIAALILYFGLIRPHVPVTIKGTYMTTPVEVPEFNLTNNLGQAMTRNNFKGHWTLLFFGFTHCPMICPTTMTVLNEMYQKLQAQLAANKMPQVVFISVDPERDTVQRLNQFVHSFNSHFIGARGSLNDIAALEKQLHISASTSNPISHSMDILLINPQVKVQAYFSYPHQADRLAEDYMLIIKNVS